MVYGSLCLGWVAYLSIYLGKDMEKVTVKVRAKVQVR